jgi:hypothetical protein
MLAWTAFAAIAFDISRNLYVTFVPLIMAVRFAVEIAIRSSKEE